MAGSRCEVEGRPLVVVSLVQVDTLDMEASDGLEIARSGGGATCNDRLKHCLEGLAGAISLLLILVEQVEVEVDLVKLFDHADASHAVALIVQRGRP